MENIPIPKTKTPGSVVDYHAWIKIIPTLGLTLILLLIKILLSVKFGIHIPAIFIFLSIPIVILAFAFYKPLLDGLHEMVPPYFVLPVLDEKTSKIRILFSGLNKISANEQPELANGKKHYLDMKRVIAKRNTSIFETKKGGSAKCEWLLALSVKILNNYKRTENNILNFNSKHSDAVRDEINAKIMNIISSFYSAHEFEEQNNTGLVYETWVQEQLFGEQGSASGFKKRLEDEYGVNIGISIYNSNPVDEVLAARNSISKAKAFDSGLQIIAKGLADQGIDKARADHLTKLVFNLTTEKNENYNVAITGLENAQNISIISSPLKGGAK